MTGAVAEPREGVPGSIAYCDTCDDTFRFFGEISDEAKKDAARRFVRWHNEGKHPTP